MFLHFLPMGMKYLLVSLNGEGYLKCCCIYSCQQASGPFFLQIITELGLVVK
jgi:hypothetical protein